MQLLDFLSRNVDSAQRSNSSFAVHEVKIGPFSRWLTFCWHEAIGAKYWVFRKYSEAVRIGKLHIETGENVAKQSREGG